MTLSSLISEVRSLLNRKRLLLLTLVFGSGFSYGICGMYAVYGYSKMLGAALLAGFTGAAVVYSYRKELFKKYSQLDACRLIDRHLNCKDRTAAFFELSNNTLGEDPGQAQAKAEFIEKQLNDKIAAVPPEEIVLPALPAGVKHLGFSLPVVWIIIAFLTFPLFQKGDGAVESAIIKDLIKSHRELPAPLREELKQLASAIDDYGLSDEKVREALKRSEDELDRALKESEKEEQAGELKQKEQPQSSPTPQVKDNREKKEQQKENKSKSEQGKKDSKKEKQDKTDVQHSKSSSQKNKKQQESSKDSKRKQGKGKSGKEKDQKSSDTGKQGEKESKQSGRGKRGKNNSGQGEKSGEKADKDSGKGSSSKKSKGASTDKQQKNSAGKDGEKSGEQKSGTGQKKSSESGSREQSGRKGERKEQSAKSSRKSGNGSKKGQSSKQQGLNAAKDALNKIKQGINKKEVKDKGKKSKTRDKGSKQNDVNKKGPDETKPGDKDKIPASSKESGNRGNKESSKDDFSRDQEKGQQPPLPKPGEKAKRYGPFAGGKDGDFKGKEKFKDVAIGSSDEKLDTRYLSDKGKIAGNRGSAEYKTNLGDLNKLRPEPVKNPDSQSIPLEYRELME